MDAVAIMKQLDSAEVKVEEKLHHLHKYMYHMLGLTHSSEFYHERGKFLARYLAGFVDRIFELFEDIAYIIFDPLHIINIVHSFARGIFLHPIQTFKAVAKVLIRKHTTAYGLGVLTAEAFILTLSAAAVAKVGSLVVEAEESMVVAGTAAKSVQEGALISKRVSKVAKEVVHKFQDYEEIFHQVRGNPHEIINLAKNSIKTGKSTHIVAGVQNFLKIGRATRAM